ncbi:MAG: polyphosphate kinase 2, partial [Sulfitobacter sp.]|nr:polyphosphate kinase 2 [Sulfitobacter sp.]
VIRSNDKKRARLTCMRHFLASLDYPDKDTEVAKPPDPLIFHQAEKLLRETDHILATSLHPKNRKSTQTK